MCSKSRNQCKVLLLLVLLLLVRTAWNIDLKEKLLRLVLAHCLSAWAARDMNLNVTYKSAKTQSNT